MSSHDWWETSGGKSRFIRRLGLIRATTAQRQSRPRVLLIGAGNGSWYQNLAEFCELKAIDISPKMVSSLRDRLPEQQRVEGQEAKKQQVHEDANKDLIRLYPRGNPAMNL